MPRTVRFTLTLGLILAFWPLGCSSPLDKLEEDAERMVTRHQRQALGPHATHDPGFSPPRPGDGPAPEIYDQQPGTTNPPPSELPAQPPEGQTLGQAPADEEETDGLNLIPPVLDPTDDQPTTVLDLSGILAFAISNSPEYRSEKESLYLAALRLIIERHRWGPRFFETASALVTGTPETGDFDTSLELLNQLQVTQRLPYGGQISASALVDYVTFLRTESTTGGADPSEDSQGTTLGASLTLPLLEGFGRVAREPLIQAERNLIYAARNFERFRREFLVELSNRYFDLIAVQRQIENQERQLENLERLAARFQALADAGRAPAFEAARAQQQVLFGRSSLLNLRERYASALDQFKIRLGLPTTRPLVITPARIAVPEVALEPTRAVPTALDLRLDLQTTRDEVEDARRQVRVAKNELLPELDVEADVDLFTEADEDFGGVDLDPGEGQYTAGFVLNTELNQRIERADYRATLIDWERSRRDYQLARDRVARAVREAIRQIKQARFTLALQEKNVELAERRARGVALRERELGPRDVIEAQEDLLEARNERDLAVSDLRQSVLQFLLNTGQMRVSASGQWQPPGKLVPVPTETEPATEVEPADPVPADEDAPPPADLTDGGGEDE